MVDRTALIKALEPYGNVDLCESHLDTYYLIVMSDYNSDKATFEAITNIYVIPYFPNLVTFTLVDGILKSQFNK